MYSYTLANQIDSAVFFDACDTIEKIEGVRKDGTKLVDVDGSLIQKYKSGNNGIKVFCDCLVDAVYVDSDIDLDHVFPKETKVDM